MNEEFILFSRLCNYSIKNILDIETCSQIYDALGCNTVISRAKAAKMLPFIANTCLACNRDVDVWRPIYNEYKERNDRIINGLEIIYDALTQNGVKRIFLTENFGALLSSGGDTALFASGDVDNCADFSENEIISETMMSLGFKEERRYAGHLYISAEYSNPSILPDGFEFGVQWEPLARLTLPSFVHLNDFVDWGRLRKVSGTSINLPPIDALMYICLLHISLHSFCRAPAIRLYRDLVNCSEGVKQEDWNRITQWANTYKTITRMSTSAYVGHKIADLSVPAEVLSRLSRKLINMVFEEKVGVLRKEPGRIQVLAIEILCNDDSVMSGAKDILFPDKTWKKQVYGNTDALASIKHLKDII